jgi:hypothetical protein
MEIKMADARLVVFENALGQPATTATNSNNELNKTLK